MHTTRYQKRCYWRQALVITMIAALTVPAWLFKGEVTASSPVDPEIVASFESLKKTVANLPKTLLTTKQRASLQAKLEEAQSIFVKGDRCEAAKDVALAINEAQALHKDGHNSIAEHVHNGIWTLRQDIINDLPPGKQCDDSPRANRAPKVDILESTERRLRGRITFGEARMTSVTAEGEVYTNLHSPGLEARGGRAGLPGIPFLRRLVAVPEGAKASLIVRPDEGETQTFKLNLYPNQPDSAGPADDDENGTTGNRGTPPFKKNKDVYDRDEAYPGQIGKSTHLGKARDLQMAHLSVAAGQYNPVSKTLTLFSSVEFDLSFVGGKGTFISRTGAGPLEPLTEYYLNAALNGAEVLEHMSDFLPWNIQCNEEFLILTHPDFRSAADTLAAWKNTKGIPTSVVEVNDGDGPGPDTLQDIDLFIEGRFNNCSLRPSYVLLLGDAELIPTFITVSPVSNNIPSDYPYALLSGDGSDELPDFALGRIPVDTLEQANTVVGKIVQYESNPPTEPSFYKKASMASSFRCCRLEPAPVGSDGRDFIETSERVRSELLNNGYEVDRLYVMNAEEPYAGDTTPRRYYDGTLLPAGLRAANGFEWNHDGAEMIQAINSGRFLLMHRSFGSRYRLYDPALTLFDVGDLTNGNLLPVIFSSSGDTGLFLGDELPQGNDRIHMAEHLLQTPNGGAIGVLAATRPSPPWADSQLARGFVDAVWPATEPDFGGQVSHRRLGDILNHGKLYLATYIGEEGLAPHAETSLDANRELYLWHVIGDPTLEMWTATPYLDLSKTWEEIQERTRLTIKYDSNGAVITALQLTKGGVVTLGRATVVDGKATIVFIRRPVAGVPIQLSASLENAVSVRLTGNRQ